MCVSGYYAIVHGCCRMQYILYGAYSMSFGLVSPGHAVHLLILGDDTTLNKQHE